MIWARSSFSNGKKLRVDLSNWSFWNSVDGSWGYFGKKKKKTNVYLRTFRFLCVTISGNWRSDNDFESSDNCNNRNDSALLACWFCIIIISATFEWKTFNKKNYFILITNYINNIKVNWIYSESLNFLFFSFHEHRWIFFRICCFALPTRHT